MGMLKKFDVSQVKLNMFFSAPVFFDDGKNQSALNLMVMVEVTDSFAA